MRFCFAPRFDLPTASQCLWIAEEIIRIHLHLDILEAWDGGSIVHLPPFVVVELAIHVAGVAASAQAGCLDCKTKLGIKLTRVNMAGMGKLRLRHRSDSNLDEPKTITVRKAAEPFCFGLSMCWSSSTEQLEIDVPSPKGMLAVGKLDILTGSQARVPNILEEWT